jgi:chromosome segregation ATPase
LETTTALLPTTTTSQPDNCSIRCTLVLEFDDLSAHVINLDYKVDTQNEAIGHHTDDLSNLRAENDKLLEKISDQDITIKYLESTVRKAGDKIEELNLKVIQQSNVIESYEKRLGELEAQMKEVSSNPCSQQIPCSQ